jgi:predicted ATPase
MERITSIRFKNYKVFKSFSVSIKDFNVLVGPNNAGKSIVLGALRILGEALRKAKSKNPELVPASMIAGYSLLGDWGDHIEGHVQRIRAVQLPILAGRI